MFRKMWFSIMALLLAGGTVGCEAIEDEVADRHIATHSAAVLEPEIETVYDDSAAPVHIQIRACTSGEAAAEHQELDCRVDPEFVLVGGSAQTMGMGSPGSPFLTESRPLDGRTWRASSTDHLIASNHKLTVYAIGMRLEGVHSRVLKESIRWKEVLLNGDTGTVDVTPGWTLLAGGGRTVPAENANGIHRFMTALYPAAYHQWAVASSDHFLPADGTTTAWLLEIEDKIIEGFGRLEIKHLAAHAAHTDVGFSTSSVEIESGWALIGMGGRIENDPGQTGRMFTGIAPGLDGRRVSATSREQIDISSGTTRAYALQARWVAGSHGVCTPGGPLAAPMDRCVADICRLNRQCCTDSWDDTCIDMVESECHRPCTEHRCEVAPFEPEKWNYNYGTEEEPVYTHSGDNVASNCTYYARNKYPDEWGLNPGDSLDMDPEEEDDHNNFERRLALLEGEGLIRVDYDEACTGNRTKVMYSEPSFWAYHWYRKDRDGRWSDKHGTGGAAKRTIKDDTEPPLSEGTAAPWPYQVYFCSCNLPLPAESPFSNVD